MSSPYDGKLPPTGFDFRDPNTEQAMVRRLLTPHSKLNFVQRILQPGGLKLKQGEEDVTHKMAWATVDGRNVVFPTVVQQGDKLVDLGDGALDYALKTGEFIALPDGRSAEWLSRRYKALWGM
jgi:hypothetical protein